MSNSQRVIFSTGPADELQSLRERISELDEQIANLKRLEDAIRRNTRLFEALLASSQDGIALTGPDATIIRIIKSILGYGPSSLSGSSLYDIVHPDDHATMRDCYAQLIRDRGHQVHREVRLLKHDGSFAWVQDTITDMLDDPNVLAVVHNYRVITKLKEAEITALEFAAAVELAPFALFSKDLTGNIQSWNSGAERLFGYAGSEILGQHIGKLVPLELQDEEKALRVAVAQNGMPVGPLRTIRVHKVGTLIPVELTLTPMVRDGVVRGIIHLSRTLSDTPTHALGPDR